MFAGCAPWPAFIQSFFITNSIFVILVCLALVSQRWLKHSTLHGALMSMGLLVFVCGLLYFEWHHFQFGWKYQISLRWQPVVYPLIVLHKVFAALFLFLFGKNMISGFRGHLRGHKRQGWVAVGFMGLTYLSGVIFIGLSFCF